jgi:hypothetical protein
MTTASEDRSRPRRLGASTVCLVVGAYCFVSVPLAFTLGKFGGGRPWDLTYQVANAVAGSLLFSVVPAALLALWLGLSANRVPRRIDGEPSRDSRAKVGMLLAAAGIGSLLTLIQLTRARFDGGVSAAGCLRTINTAAMTYASTYGRGFPLRLSCLGPPNSVTYDPSTTSSEAAGLIDSRLAAGTAQGYRIYYVAGPRDSQGKILRYTVHADPVDPKAGDVHYFTDETQVIRMQSKWQANASSPPVK